MFTIQPRHQLCILLLLTMTVTIAALAPHAAAKSNDIKITVPLDDGAIDIADLIRQGLSSAGITPSAELNKLSWPITVDSMLGRAQLRAIERLTDSMITIDVTDDLVRLTIDQQALLSRTGAAQSWLSDMISVSDGGSPRSFGMFMLPTDGTPQPINANSTLPERVIVLVHGLDDPGWLWNDTITALQDHGYHVARLEYPNDGAISDAADLLALELTDMRQAGVQRVDLIAHSMGGLVCRDVLTRKAYYNGDGAGNDRLPAVDRLLMLGTPNHGSHLVRLRAITEVQEQLSRAFTGVGDWRNAAVDGNGEAAIDLTPGSPFLKRLNRRSLPTHTQITIVAGRWSALDEVEVGKLKRTVRQVASSDFAPQWLRDWTKNLDTLPVDRAFAGVVNGLGDGAVSLDSSRLDGVDDYIIVQANHISMIVHTGSTTAPAIAIVLDRLGKELPVILPAID